MIIYFIFFIIIYDMDFDNCCKKCNYRIGNHTIYDSVKCKLIKKNQLKNVELNHIQIWELLNEKLIDKDTAVKLFQNLPK
jgi:hypothetical protein